MSNLLKQELLNGDENNIEWIWLFLPIRQRKAIWAQDYLDEIIIRMPKTLTKERVMADRDLWDSKFNYYCEKMELFITQNEYLFNLTKREFSGYIKSKMDHPFHGYLYRYFDTKDIELAKKDLRFALFTNRIL